MRNSLTRPLSTDTAAGGAAWYAGLPEAHRYTERLKRALALAEEEARRIRHRHLGTEHLLLGLLAEGQGVGAKALLGFGVELSQLRERLVMTSQSGRGPAASSPEPAPPARRALRFAVHEAKGLGHAYVGQEHLLLALAQAPDERSEQAGEPTSVTLLRDASIDTEALRRAVMEAMTRGTRSVRDNVIACRVDDRAVDSIDALIEAGIHATRSEAAARLILDGLEANGPLLERVRDAVADIRRLREQTQRLAEQWRAERASPLESAATPSHSASAQEQHGAERSVPAAPRRSRRTRG